eukprot:UN13582
MYDRMPLTYTPLHLHFRDNWHSWEILFPFLIIFKFIIKFQCFSRDSLIPYNRVYRLYFTFIIG